MSDQPALPAAETVMSFQTRMFGKTPETISDEDWSTLMAIFEIGAQRMIELGGPNVPVPGDQ